MRIVRLFKFVLLIFECVNFLFIAAIMIFRGIEQIGLARITFMASLALFPLMALFILLDNDRYKVFMPLFAAGKCIGLFSILCWSIFARQVKISEVLSGTADIESFLLYGYLFSIVVILFIIRDKKFINEKIIDEKKLEVV